MLIPVIIMFWAAGDGVGVGCSVGVRVIMGVGCTVGTGVGVPVAELLLLGENAITAKTKAVTSIAATTPMTTPIRIARE
jgi:hypothetical protein